MNCRVQLKRAANSSPGIICGYSEADTQKVRVRWTENSTSTMQHLSSLTSGFANGHHVIHRGSHSGIKSLGRGQIIGSRHLAGSLQHYVYFWELNDSRWLPWETLAWTGSVDYSFRNLNRKPGNPEKLRLKNLAYALTDWDHSSGGLSRLEIDPLPHQVYVVNKILTSGTLNWLIADDVGLGKTIEVGLLLAALREQKLKRFLIIVPAGLTRQWEEELREKFLFDDFVIYGETASPETPGQWRLYDRVIVSMDRAKNKEHLSNFLQAEDWDLIIIDEAHRLSRHEYGGAIDTTDRYALAETLRSRTGAMLLLTGTPHQGRDDLFRGLLELLRPGYAWRQRFLRIKDNPAILGDIIIRNRKADVTDHKGNFIFRGKTSSTIEVERTEAEWKFEQELTDYFRAGYSAGSAQGHQGQAIGFVMTTYRKLAASSFAAIANALRKRMLRLQSSSGPKDFEFPDAAEDLRFVESDEWITGGATEFFEGELASLFNLTSQAQALAQSDSKVDALFEHILPRILEQNPHEKVLIFTEYRSTQDILMEQLHQRFGEESTGLIRGGQPMNERRAVVDSFNDDLQFLVSTEAGGEGINLQQNCHIMINFDLPWNPMRLVQRVGRLYRYGQKKRVVVFNVKAARTLDQDILSGMYERLDKVAEDMATVLDENREGLIEDILGQLASLIDVREVLETASSTEEFRSSERIAAAIEKAKNAARNQARLLEYAAAFDPKAASGRLELSVSHLKAFAEAMLTEVGISIVNRVHQNDVWDLRLPEQWQRHLAWNQNVRISFDHAKARKYRAQLFDKQSPLLRELLQLAKEDPEAEAASIGLADLIFGYSVLLRRLDETGHPVETEYLAITQNSAGGWNENGADWTAWLLEPAVTTTPVKLQKGPTPADYAVIREVIEQYLERTKRKGLIPDSWLPISGFTGPHWE